MAWVGTWNVRRRQWWNAQLLNGDIDNTSTKDRLQALEKLAVSMHGDVIQARTAAAARAEQGATDVKARVLGARSEGVEDARSPGNPRSLEDATDNCRKSKFAFMDYAGAVDARLEQARLGTRCCKVQRSWIQSW